MRTNKGFAALASVLAIGGFIITMAGGMALRARNQVLSSIGNIASVNALAQADACTEIAIGKLQTTIGYAGNESIAINGITCEILPITGTGNYNRTITARATVQNHTKKVSVTIVKISSPTVISSWKETD